MIKGDHKVFSPEDDRLISHYIRGSKHECLQIADDFANQLDTKRHTIIQRAFQLGCIKYIPFSAYLLSHRRDGYRNDEVNVLINNRLESRKQLARVLDRSHSSVNKQMYCFRLMSGGHDYDWRDEESQLLTQIAGTHSLNDISIKLGRSNIDIKHQCIERGILLETSGEAFTRGGHYKKLEPTVGVIACAV